MCSRGHWYACVQYCKKKWRLRQLVRSVLGAFLLLPWKKKFSETSGLRHNSLSPKCKLSTSFLFFFSFFSAKLVYKLARAQKKTTRPGQKGFFFFFFSFLGVEKMGLSSHIMRLKNNLKLSYLENRFQP
jgi:hypothetical protein